MMLSRTANSLFWTGRYIERLEHLSRYLNAQYLSSADAPRALNKQMALESMLSMARATDAYYERYAQIEDDKVILFLTIDDEYPFSMKNYLSLVRENSRGLRDNLSTEVWETINRFYHSSAKYTVETFQKKGPYDYCKHILNHVNIIKGVADNTLLRNQSWSLIRAGINLERTLQICKILITKLEDINKLDAEDISPAVAGYHWSSLLRSAGGFDMSRHYYHESPNRERGVEFLILNKKFPKSVLFNLKELQQNLTIIGDHQAITPDTAEFLTGKLIAYMDYLTVDDIVDEGADFLYQLENQLIHIGNTLENQYLQY